jgi:hypothetical protein
MNDDITSPARRAALRHWWERRVGLPPDTHHMHSQERICVIMMMHPHHSLLAVSLVMALGTPAVQGQQTSLSRKDLAAMVDPAAFTPRDAPMTSAAPEQLVAEGSIRDAGPLNGLGIYLPVTIHGRAGTILAGWGQTVAELSLSHDSALPTQ